MAAVRAILFYEGGSRLVAVGLLAAYGLFYAAEPLLPARARWLHIVYLPLQAALVLTLGNLRPFLDFGNALYVPLSLRRPRAVALADCPVASTRESEVQLWSYDRRRSTSLPG